MGLKLLLFIFTVTCLPVYAAAAERSGRKVETSSSFFGIKNQYSSETIKPELSVEIDLGKPAYIHKNSKFYCSGDLNHGGGCTRVSIYAVIKSSDFTENGAFRSVKLQIGLKNVEVEVSSDLKKGSCLFDAVLKHELTHLALHRQILKRFAPEIAKAVLATIESLSPPVTEPQINKIERVLNDFVERMMKEDDRQNALMDSQEAYRHLHGQCREGV